MVVKEAGTQDLCVVTLRVSGVLIVFGHLVLTKMTLVLDQNQMKKAIAALMSHSEKVKESGATRQLFEDEGDVFNLQIALKKVPEKVSEKPVRTPSPTMRLGFLCQTMRKHVCAT